MSVPLARLLAAVVALLLAIAPTVGAPQADAQPVPKQFLQIQIDTVSPDLVTTTSDPLVTVTGRIRNIGDRPVRDVVVRLERADAVSSSTALRTNLTGNVDQYQPVADFITVAPELARGQDVPFRLAYPLRAAAQSLSIDQPGVYPVMVNVNGTPDYGAPARLDDSRFLLPVLGVPPADADGSPADTGSVDSAVPPDTTRPVAMTLLWPLADRPRLAAGAPGETTPVRLIDDELATSLAPGGRLDTMLSAVDFATGPAVDPRGELARAVCLAVDPDLLITVNAMTNGYVVNAGPEAGRGTATYPGAGRQAAIDWLARLRAVAARLCVTATTYAQADLDALHRVGDFGLSAIATRGAADIVAQILGVPVTRGATLVGDGPMTAGTVQLLSAQGPTVAIGAADLSGPQDGDGSRPQTAEVSPVRYTPNVVAAPFDPAVGAALASVGAQPESPSYLSASLDTPLKQDSAVARRQDALGAMLWQSLDPDVTPRTQLLVPPLMWGLSGDDAAAVLSAVGTAIRSGLAVPRPLRAVIDEAAAVHGSAELPSGTTGNPRGRFDDGVVSGIAATTGRLWGLTAALGTDERTGLTGAQYTAPLREDMLRALSLSVPPDARAGLAQQRLTTVSATVTDLFNAVTIVNPGGSYTLATERSPLPLALRNDLPVPIRVRLDIDAPPGMTVTDMGEIVLPPGFLPLKVPIEVHFTQRVAVDVALRTANGLPLGEPARLSVHSNAYGKVLFIITLTGGAVLVLLVGRRLWHRFRGQPDPADLDRPDPIEVALAFPDDPAADTAQPARTTAGPRRAPTSRGGPGD
ncbi:hypothetical protein CRI77_24480 [Mycolicibacterium duvalii]|uniref:Uncharacterized protein n=1 Tax=Mycolicibacterium duvalii TaxID=39688 RepID=A0A7I7K5R3_9MYCO|nr:DUF6049 family protein [Mycolicibacterium duvalii]MCV7365981.1 hypothetical protein [Mycolicibacterium duvalii]PEG35860.1 hypothetical protein CRI77_24480 [Mycolicibacterium duvalii]BBX19425.1 hypothetical protein MDUV_42850 [Mycolicibacterium duvalii]